MACYLEISLSKGHIWPMIFSLQDQMAALGQRINARRLTFNLMQYSFSSRQRSVEELLEQQRKAARHHGSAKL